MTTFFANCVAKTPNGREVVTTKDGRFECQPPNDNYWVQGDTIEEALRNAGWYDEPQLSVAKIKKCEMQRIYDVDSLSLAGWKKGEKMVSAAEYAGYDYRDYFADGVYLGPDQDGIEPVFAAH